ncbi:MAG: hypothetical protein CVU17_10765 [Betaproteobacteria bacterium HGW-Betaproteobacteria-11]|nr:MAG: hypothetical protein CVU17_10765 [Betaproteobacteria bacterium HGW-Betaproteobacteria-11]
MLWTYVGMFVGGNLGMFLLDELWPNRSQTLGNVLYVYAVCNVGMLFGMVPGERIATWPIVNVNQVTETVLLVTPMVLDMTFGITALLALVSKVL